jgi:hypothetical protein
LKKALSILLLSVFLFNVGGYYIVFWAMLYQSDQQLTTILDAGLYEEDETVELKIPLSLPYAMMSRGFQRVDGKFEYKGEYYRLVKQKVHNDTVFVVCIKNHEEKQLVNKMTDYVTQSNDIPGTAKKAMSFVSKLLKEYNPGAGSQTFESGNENITEVQFSEFSEEISSLAISIPSPPPRA